MMRIDYEEAWDEEEPQRVVSREGHLAHISTHVPMHLPGEDVRPLIIMVVKSRVVVSCIRKVVGRGNSKKFSFVLNKEFFSTLAKSFLFLGFFNTPKVP